MKKHILSITTIFCLVTLLSTPAAGKKKIEIKPPAKSPYERLIHQEGCISAKSEFLSLHKVKNTLYMELPLTYLGRDMLLSTAITKTTHMPWNSVGNKMNNPLHVKFSLENDRIYLRQVSSSIVYDRSNTSITKTAEATYMDRYIGMYEIETYNTDSSSVVINVSNLFVADTRDVSPVASYFNKATTSFNKSLSYLGEIKAFSDNALIKSVLSYDYQISGPAQGGPWSAAGVNVWTMEVTRSLLLLPEKPMKPRLGDWRIGFLDQEMLEIDYSNSERLNEQAYIHRWRLEPKDPAAWERGELVEPVKPIVFYVDNSFPEVWKPGIKAGILAWNKSFEKIGFKNVMNVLDFPTDDPDFDPDNLKYSCVRFVPAGEGTGRGPAWVDPRSGEFVNASIMIFANIAGHMSTHRFIATAQIDPRVRLVKMPDDLTRQSVEDIMIHEVGHTLGLAHNMTGSAAYPVDSLRSPDFVKKYGISASIMDYAQFNYVAQPGDKGVNVSPQIGPYDDLCIKYAYSPIPGNLSVKEEAAIAEKWLDEKAGDPLYRFVVQQWKPLDPSTLSNDSGDDPIKAGSYGVKNLQYILSNLDSWFPEADQISRVYELYKAIVERYNLYIKHASYNIGGIYLTSVKPGTPGKTFKPVPAEVQKQAVEWILGELKNCNWINPQKLTSKFPLSLDRSIDIRINGMKALMEIVDNVILSSHIADKPYTLNMYFDDLYKGIWTSTIDHKKLTEGDKIMQRIFINTLYSEMESTEKSGKIFDQTAWDNEKDAPGFSPLETATAYALTPSQGSQDKIDVSIISEKTAYSQLMLEKIRTLIENRIKTADPADKAHYKTILDALE